MAWTTPTTPVAGAVITVAWAQTNLLDNLNWLRAMTGAGSPAAADRVAISTSTTATAWGQVGAGAIAAGVIGTTHLADGAVTTVKIGDTQVTAAKLAADVYRVPTGLIAAFVNAVGIPSGWARFTNLDGKIPVGAGTSYGQTFVEGASAGNSWAHQHSVSLTSAENSPGAGSVSSGGGSTSVPTHTHGVSGNSADVTWIPPMFTVVFAQKS